MYRNTSIESTVKSFDRTKDGRGAYLAIIANHAGDTKYRAIYKLKNGPTSSPTLSGTEGFTLLRLMYLTIALHMMILKSVVNIFQYHFLVNLKESSG